MWELDHEESWVLKNWYFWTVVLEKTLESPWTARRSSQSILKEISPEYSLGGLMLKLKLQYFGHLMWRTDLLEKPLMLGKTEGGRRRGRQRMRTQRTWIWANSRRRWRTGRPGVLQSKDDCKELDTTEWLNDKIQPLQWTTSGYTDINEASDETMQQVP